jgi:hypothetical protein
MRLPSFLRFLEPRVKPPRDGLKFRGDIRVERQVKGGELELIHESKNFIVDAGVSAIRDILVGVNGGGFYGSIFRMAVGDGGTPPAELFNPYLADATWPARTALYHEVLRQDITVFTTPTTASMRFVGSFNSVGVDPTSYSVAAKVINEASLIAGDGVLTGGGDKKEINRIDPPGPDVADPDEVMVSTRTFKSASFDPAEDVTITITWTITIAT